MSRVGRVDHAGVASAFAYGGAATLLAALVAFLVGPKQAEQSAPVSACQQSRPIGRLAH